MVNPVTIRSESVLQFLGGDGVRNLASCTHYDKLCVPWTRLMLVFFSGNWVSVRLG